MPVEIGSFTTEVSMHDRELPLSPRQLEAIVQETAKRILRMTQEEQTRQQSASFGSNNNS